MEEPRLALTRVFWGSTSATSHVFGILKQRHAKRELTRKYEQSSARFFAARSEATRSGRSWRPRRWPPTAALHQISAILLS